MLKSVLLVWFSSSPSRGSVVRKLGTAVPGTCGRHQRMVLIIFLAVPVRVWLLHPERSNFAATNTLLTFEL